MKHILLVAAAMLAALSNFATDCRDCRYAAPIFDSIQVIKNLRFAQGPDLNNAQKELFLDIYLPVGDTTTNRPVFIFAFGGGFVQGKKTDNYVVLACERYAKSGYVAVAIDYRIGINYLAGISNPTGEAMKVFFRPMQDMRASVQYMKQSFAEKGNIYGIDTNHVYIGGASAGGITALNVAYCDKDTEFAELGNLNNISGLGGFYATSALDTFKNYSWKTAGVVNIAGAIFNTNWIEAGDPPVYSAHGDQDGTVPYKDGTSTNGLLSILGIKMEGSYLVDSVANARGVCSYLYTLVGEDHPSGGKPMSYYEAIFIRGISRFFSLVNGRTFCCNAIATIAPPDPVYIEPGATVEFTGSIALGFVPPNYLWCSYPCTDVFTTQTFQTQPDTNSYFVLLVNDGFCDATDFVGVFDAKDTLNTSIKFMQSGNLKALAYPNPAKDRLMIALSVETDYSLTLINTAGSVVNEAAFSGNKHMLNTAGLPRGLYVLRIAAAGKTLQQKVMIE